MTGETSQAHGLSRLTLPAMLEWWAAALPRRPALVDAEADERVTYDELRARVHRAAGSLRALGLRAGDRVGFWSANRVDAITLIYAAAALGLVWAPVNARLTAGEALVQVRASRLRLLVVDDLHAEAARTFSLPNLRVVGWAASANAPGWLDAPGVLADGPGGEDPDRPAAILYTSGSTGEPKGVVHSDRTLMGWCLGMVLAAGWTTADRILIPYPLFHMGGAGFVLAAHLAGATAVILRAPRPETLHRALADEHITALATVPTVLAALAGAGSAPEKGLARLAVTSAPIFAETLAATRRLFPQARISALYSATEALFTVMDPAELLERPTAVGRPVFGAEIQVVPHTGLTDGGVVYTRGMSVFRGYDGREPTPAGGWITCDDVGHLDDEGYLYLTDRLKDLVRTGGETVASREVERVLLSHPDVREAAVVGLPDAYWGERVHAVLALRGGHSLSQEDVRAWCQGRLAPFKIPKSVTVVDELPKNAAGKIDKPDIRRTLLAGYGSS